VESTKQTQINKCRRKHPNTHTHTHKHASDTQTHKHTHTHAHHPTLKVEVTARLKKRARHLSYHVFYNYPDI